MSTWTVRFRGADERDTLAKADLFYRTHEENLGMTREAFFAQLVLSEDGTQAAFIEGARGVLWGAEEEQI